MFSILKSVLALGVGLIMSASVGAQASWLKKQADWQQRVDYWIEVELNDTLHTLSGKVKMEYFNNSPNDLNELYVHLWPNAYSSRNTAFAKQQLENGNTDFHFSEAKERGSIQGLDFSVNGQKVRYEFWKGHKDVALIQLPKPLKSGEKMIIETPFETKVPGSFSRFGHEDQDYQVTQWYPKPAVYDVNGWNPMPYLDQGEFYSEFGKFEVQITVPDNYVVAATGILQEEREKRFLRDRSENPVNPFEEVETSKNPKTLTYVQDSIHDFAWFASKYFNVQMDEVELEADGQKKTVETFVFAPQKQINWTSDINKTLDFYSSHVGMYPYDHCTVVKGPLKAGGGMEYPMITVVAELGKTVIVHEVGHNWFYGILGTDERRYPWMDESINSYFEQKTIRNKPKKEELGLPKITFGKINELAMLYLAELAENTQNHQAVGTHSEELTNMNYGTMVYGKGAYVFDYLREYLGDDKFYECFKSYYQKWKFKHPLPEDMEAVFEEVTDKNLDWFFKGLIDSDESLDFSIVSYKTLGDKDELTIRNHSSIPVPVSLGFYGSAEDEPFDKKWIEGFSGDTTIEVTDVGAGFFKLDPGNYILETCEKNNLIKTDGAFKRVEPFDLKPIIGRENPDATTVFVTPLIAWNNYDKWMIGAHISNMNALGPRFKYRFSPLYSPSLNSLNGLGALSWEKYMNRRFNKLEIGVLGQRFAHQPFSLLKTYTKVEPYFKLYFRGKTLRDKTDTYIKGRYIYITQQGMYDESEEVEKITNDLTGRRSYTTDDPLHIGELLFNHQNYRALNPYSLELKAEVGQWNKTSIMRDTLQGRNFSSQSSSTFIKLFGEFNYRFTYPYKRKGLDVRIFGGYIVEPTLDGFYDFQVSQASGRWDYKYDHLLMNRGAREGVFQNRILHRDLNLKLVGNLGNINQWTAGVNLVSGLPGKLPFSVYADIFTYNGLKDQVGTDGSGIAYSGGIQVNVIPTIFMIYLPAVNSEFIVNAQELQGFDTFWNRITFSMTLPLNKLVSVNQILSSVN
jgi:hypothetical protein